MAQWPAQLRHDVAAAIVVDRTMCDVRQSAFCYRNDDKSRSYEYLAACLAARTYNGCEFGLNVSPDAVARKNKNMLILSRKREEQIVIADNIVITVVEIRGDKVRLGIEAPKEVPVHRREVYDRIQREKSQPPAGASTDTATGQSE